MKIYLKLFCSDPRRYDQKASSIPKTCRTLLKTMKTTPLKEVKPGQYYHFGLASRVKYMLDRYGGHLTPEMYDILKFLINTDGLPVVYVLDHLFYILAEGVLDRCWRFT